MTIKVNIDRAMRDAHVLVAIHAARDAAVAGNVNEVKLHLDAALDFITQETVVEVKSNG